MILSFENQGTNTYLVCEIGTDDELDTLSLGMLTNNAIPGFAATSFMQVDTSKYVRFNVSSKVSVSQLFSGPVNKRRLLGVFSGIVDAMLAAEDYMLDTSNLLLDLDYIFADVSTCETVVVCLPVLNSGHSAPDVGMFFKNIIFNTQFDQTENCDHVAQILNYLNRASALMLDDFKALLEKIKKGNEPTSVVQIKVSSSAGKEPDRPVSMQERPETPKKPVEQPRVPAAGELKFGGNYSPVEKPKSAELPPVSAAPETDEKESISMFYLLQHYNKENAAKYKAQQEAKKAKKAGASAPAPARPAKKAASSKPSAGFAIPGQQEPVNAGFAVPGQPEPPVTPPSAHPTKSEPKPVIVQPAPVTPPAAPQPQPISFGETSVLIGAEPGATTVLGVQVSVATVAPYLVREKNGEQIAVNKPVFRVGKERSYVDYFIGDNTAVSRSHANVISKDGAYFVVDTNSTNHTFVNGAMIPSMVEVAITDGDKIRFGNEEFTFRVM